MTETKHTIIALFIFNLHHSLYYYYYYYYYNHLHYGGNYTHIPDTNYVPREHSVAAIMLLILMVLISLVSVLNLLNFYISTFRSMCSVSYMAVFRCP